MYKKNTVCLKKALRLKNDIVGIKFIKNADEFASIESEQIKAQVNFCYMVRKAVNGNRFKAAAENFRCQNAVYAMGLKKPNIHVTSGELLSVCGLYENAEIAKDVIDSMKYLTHSVFGIEIGPLAEMTDVDSVIIIANAEQTMRIFQGYTYHYGPAGNLLSMGNQAMCSDLVAKPLSNNDINMSFFCKGARLYGKCDPGELGIGMPADMFANVVNGVVKTLTPVESNEVKKEILQSLDSPDELGTEIIMDTDYVKTIAEYVEKLEKQTKN